MQVVCCDHATSCTGYIAPVFAAVDQLRRHIRQERYSAYGWPNVSKPQKRSKRAAIPNSSLGEVRRRIAKALKTTLPVRTGNKLPFHPKQVIQPLRLTLNWRLRRMTNRPPMIIAPPSACAALIVSPSQIQAAAIATMGVRFWIMAA